MPRTRPSRTQLWLVLGPLIVLVVAAQVGDALAPTLVTENPALLIALNARNRNLILVTNQLEALPYYGIGFVRLLLADPLFYVLGYWYGDAGIRWVEKRSSSFGGLLRTWEWMFAKAAWPLIVIAPNNPICLFAGATGMAPVVFVTLNVVGTVGRLILIRILGETFEAPIDWLLEFIRDHRIPLTILAVTVVAITVISDRRSGKGDLEALTSIEDELGTAEAPPEHPIEPRSRPGTETEGDADTETTTGTDTDTDADAEERP